METSLVKTKLDQGILLLSKTGLVNKEGLPTKRTYGILFLGGSAYAFTLLLSWLLTAFGQTFVSLGVFSLLFICLWKIFSQQKKLLLLKKKK